MYLIGGSLYIVLWNSYIYLFIIQIETFASCEADVFLIFLEPVAIFIIIYVLNLIICYIISENNCNTECQFIMWKV